MNSLRSSERNRALCLYSIAFLVNRSKSGWPANLNPGKTRRWMLATPESIKGRAVFCPRLRLQGVTYSQIDYLVPTSRHIGSLRFPRLNLLEIIVWIMVVFGSNFKVHLVFFLLEILPLHYKRAQLE